MFKELVTKIKLLQWHTQTKNVSKQDNKTGQIHFLQQTIPSLTYSFKLVNSLTKPLYRCLSIRLVTNNHLLLNRATATYSTHNGQQVTTLRRITEHH